ncbi:peptidoglycan recognition protein family protein [Nocardiopsis oceani]
MVSIVPRSDWGARAARSRDTVAWSARTGFTVHYSAGSPTQTVRSIQDFHMGPNAWSDIGYNFLVDQAGTAFEGRGWTVVGAHAAPHNSTHVGVCFIGSDGDATDAAKATIRALYDEACTRAGRTLAQTWHGGLSGNSTSCPGADLRAWVQAGMPATDSLEGHMLGLKRGDTGARVELLQTRLRHAGFAELLGTSGPRGDGVDGDYGSGTEGAVLAARKYVGSGATSGATISGPAAAQIERAATKKDIERAIDGLDLDEGSC